jgi:hypothetical protein
MIEETPNLSERQPGTLCPRRCSIPIPAVSRSRGFITLMPAPGIVPGPSSVVRAGDRLRVSCGAGGGGVVSVSLTDQIIARLSASRWRGFEQVFTLGWMISAGTR